MRRASLLLLLFCGACFSGENGALNIGAPAKLSRALSQIGEVEAGAELVPSGGAPLPRVALKRGDDGVSFSGFIPADPGDYTLEIVFTGIPAGSTSRIFLGRWISDTFTVSRGSTANTSFNRPLDVIGRQGDGGDLDSDGLGNLDEILAGSDPNSGDSDGDGVEDGDDCYPGDRGRTFAIVAGGTILDCDADGYATDDPPFGQRGPDCDDTNKDVNPGATDVCQDAVDSDCDPLSCPSDDNLAPEVTNIVPAAGEIVGCFAQLEMTIRDPSGVSGGTILFPLNPTTSGTDRVILLSRKEGDVWRSAPLANAALLGGDISGMQRLRIRAYDERGNVSAVDHTIEIAPEMPELLSFEPARVDHVTGPINLRVTGRASRGVRRIAVYAQPRRDDLVFDHEREQLIAETAGDTLEQQVDLTTLPEGVYAMYAVVEDTIGNALTPRRLGFYMGPDNTTLVDTSCRNNELIYMPARAFTVGGDSFLPMTMRQALDRALAEARAIDPALRLTQINGAGIGPDGKIDLGLYGNYYRTWSFGFYNASTRNWASVVWRTAYQTNRNPIVDPEDGSISGTTPLSDPQTLIDSSRAADLVRQEVTCPPLAERDDDYILYINDDTRDVVSVSIQGEYWRGTAHEPVSEVWSCN